MIVIGTQCASSVTRSPVEMPRNALPENSACTVSRMICAASCAIQALKEAARVLSCSSAKPKGKPQSYERLLQPLRLQGWAT